MSSELILQLREGNLLTVTINRPEKANSLTREMLGVLCDMFHAAACDEELRAVVITGAGGRVFCAGADLDTLYDEQDGPDLWAEMPQSLRAIPALTIAAVNGPCMGGGLSLALGCDIRVGVPQAKIGYPVLKNNVLPSQVDVDKMSNLIGHGRASSILLGGRTVTSDEAVAWGLIDHQTSRDRLNDYCREVAASALASKAGHLARLKSMLKENSS